MQITHIEIADFKVLKDISVDLPINSEGSSVYPLISTNGGGKSTLLQFLFTLLHCSFDEERRVYCESLLSKLDLTKEGEEQKMLLEVTLNSEQDFIFYLDRSKEAKTIIEAKKNTSKIAKEFAVRLSHFLEKVNANYKEGDKISEEDAHAIFRFFNRCQEDRISWDTLLQSPPDYESFINLTEERAFLPSKNISLKLYEIFEKLHTNFDNSETSGDITKLFTSEYLKRIRADEVLGSIPYFVEISDQNDKLKSLSKQAAKKISERGATTVLGDVGTLGVLTVYPGTTESLQTLRDFSSQIYLSGPSTQIFQFLPRDTNTTIFNQGNDKNIDYQKSLVEAEKKLPGLFTFNFIATGEILKLFEDAINTDREHLIKHGEYSDNFKNTIKELNALLANKKITPTARMQGVKFTDKRTGQELGPEDLSHGELKRLSYYVWLKNIKGGVVLIDEIDLGLHPRWQECVADDLRKWNPNCQYILGTHSPQIISSVNHKNLIMLDKGEDGKSTASQLTYPPLEGDVNTILETIMGSAFVSVNLTNLRKKYTELFKQGKEDNEEGRKLKEQMLEFESEGSSFFQKLTFLRKFQKR